MSSHRLPTIDLSLLTHGRHASTAVAAQLDAACREYGFFYLIGHGIEDAQIDALFGLSQTFFSLPVAQKRAIHMSKGGRAWRGFFQLGEELTSGKADRKEGLYFGTELHDADPRVRAQMPLHGRNLFPPIPGFREAVLEYMQSIVTLGHRVMGLLAQGLGLDQSFFFERYTHDPTILFRIFNYPSVSLEHDEWGVGAHTDYGFLTLLRQDEVAGLQVRHGDEWLEVPVVPRSFVCNVGDMLERVTRGRYLSALHRVRSSTNHDRMSMALFFDPSFDAVMDPIDGIGPRRERPHTQVRWDDLDPHAANPRYGDYLISKVGRVFPVLRDTQLSGATSNR